MPESWTGEVVGKMHNHRITNDDIAAKLGYTKAYISMILNGKREPKEAEIKMRSALAEIIAERRAG